MKRLVEHLRKYAAGINLDEKFRWEIRDPSGILVHRGINITGDSPFKRNVDLKEKLTCYFDRHRDRIDFELAFWLINEWGGIWTFKNTPKNRGRIEKFVEMLEIDSLGKELFSTVSSLSKVASFMDCNRYCIYDSRATYALNWLILRNGSEGKFFPMPRGRNTAITEYDVSTVIRLHHKSDTMSFYPEEEAYCRYCELLRELSLRVWTDEARQRKPYYLEMLLFVIAPKEIIDDVKRSVRLTIK